MQIDSQIIKKVYDMVGDVDQTELNDLLKSQVSDIKLQIEIADTANGLITEAIERAFVVGWKCAKCPEILLFESKVKSNERCKKKEVKN